MKIRDGGPVAVEVGTHDQFSAHLLVCRRGGAIFRQLEPLLRFEGFVPTAWAASKGGREDKLTVYRSRHNAYQRVLSVAYRPNSDRVDAFSPSQFNHGANISQILINGLVHLLIRGKARTTVLTSLSWRNPNMMDHVLASVLVEMGQVFAGRGGRLTVVIPEPRPKLVSLVEARDTLFRRYLRRLEEYWGSVPQH